MKNASETRFYSIKEEIRIAGFDDAHFELGKNEKTLVVGAVMRGGTVLDGVLRTEVEVDGTDSTDRIIDLMKNTKYKDIRVIMLDGLGFAGFNLVDIRRLYEETGLPVIAIVRRMPDYESIEKAITGLQNAEYYRACMEKAGPPAAVQTRPGKNIYMQYAGISRADAEEIVKLSSTRSLIPEPIRLAHLIASGITFGESRGGA